MGLAIFERYSQSKEGTNYAPLLISASQMRTFDIISQWVKKNNYQESQINKDYFEIFFKDQEFEITIIITTEGDDSLVNATVLGPMGKTRKKLKGLLQDLILCFQ